MNTNRLLNLNGTKVILASGSPRRKSLFELMGFEFEVITSDVDEKEEEYIYPEVKVLELSYKKAAKVAENVKEGIVVGADTIVVLDDNVLEKPEDNQQAKKMLRTLSGRTHTVYTGFSILQKPEGRCVSEYSKTEVSFRDLKDDEIDAYIATKSPFDKAGGYGIQDFGALFVNKVDGCFYNVMGFPVTKFYSTMRQFMNLN